MATRATNPWATWRGKSTVHPTNAECLQSCIANAEAAARLEQRARVMYERSGPGSKELAESVYELAQRKAEQRHWREYADWYRKQVAAARPVLSAVPPSDAVIHPPSKSERQPGEDDGDEQPLSAWQDIGAGVRP
jgi:hypothetical protein